ncbi:GNAT family N-acetyltransferase [Aquimarina sediminis]|uniref:GNAT family N-acetyltransferase n=1 Tax=Aquimarina sediminis TaxID=2070536 RepID=UPI000CA07A6A|nr:GNAT family N-acetyltransferase [Aquimarina sediminis]
MKQEINLIHANIDNLTSLWKIAATTYQSYYSNSKLSYGWVKTSDWPNRLWFNQDITPEIITSAKEKLASSPVPLTVPYWDIYKSKSNQILEKNGFKTSFEQIGMSLKLKKPFDKQYDLNIQQVSNRNEATQWSEIFEQSFGYRIHPDILLKTKSSIFYYLAYNQGQAVGTAVLHKTNDIIGVHSVGIPPQMRRKGFAAQLMKLLINHAIKNGNSYMTLQASDMGKNLYLKLGFEEQFIIKNYVLQDQ